LSSKTRLKWCIPSQNHVLLVTCLNLIERPRIGPNLQRNHQKVLSMPKSSWQRIRTLVGSCQIQSRKITESSNSRICAGMSTNKGALNHRSDQRNGTLTLLTCTQQNGTTPHTHTQDARQAHGRQLTLMVTNTLIRRMVKQAVWCNSHFGS